MTFPAPRPPERLPLLEPAAAGPLARFLGRLETAAPGASLPLEQVVVRARVAGTIASVAVDQTFRNALDGPVEVAYVLPLPGGAAVTSLEMRVRDRVVRAEVEERAAAARRYEAARAQGKRAALATAERDGVVTLTLGNLGPGERALVRLEYAERLPLFEDGRTELRLPLVVAPRYVPGSPRPGAPAGRGVAVDTDVVPDASRISPPRLAEGARGPALSIEVDLLLEEDGGALDDLASSRHATRVRAGADRIRVMLARVDERLDGDFVLRWRLGVGAARTTLLVHTDARGERTGVLTLLPPRAAAAAAPPRDVLVLLDCSGSMDGEKLASAARAATLLLETLGPRDRLEVMPFADTTQTLFGELTAADPAGIARAARTLRSLATFGGTEMDVALERAIAVLGKSAREDAAREAVLLLVTDGQVADEERILARVRRSLGRARLFAVGVDTAVNAAFLERLAAAGRGSAALVEPGADLDAVLRGFAREIGAPLVTDLSLEDLDAGLDAASLAPDPLPDLFAGRAATVFLRLGREGGRIRVRGRSAAGGALDEVVAARAVDLPALPSLWAHAHVRDLEDRARLADAGGRRALEAAIVALARRHLLLTPLTSLVAVDHAEAVPGAGERRAIIQPAAMPAGWSSAAGAGGGYGGLGAAAHAGVALCACAGMTLGTVAYMSPEQLMGRALAPETDLYALGAVLYELLTGTPPFHDENEMRLMKMIMREPPEPPSARARGIHAALDAAVLGALEKGSANRFRSAGEFAAALETALPLLPPAPDAIPAPRAARDPGGPLPPGFPARAGRFRITTPLDAGGMFARFLGTEDASGEAALVLVAHPHLVRADAIRRRLLSDLRAQAWIADPHVAAVREVIEEGGGLWAVCEPSEGATLEELLAALGPLPPLVAVRLALSALRALDALHAARLLHRAIAPDELWLATDGRVKLGVGGCIPPPRGTILPLGPGAAVPRSPSLEELADGCLPPLEDGGAPRVGVVAFTAESRARSVWSRLVGLVRGARSGGSRR